MESEVSEEPQRVRDMDQSIYEASHPVITIDARVSVGEVQALDPIK